MDPDANLKEMLELAQGIVDRDACDVDEAVRLAELVLALDGWLSKGGFLPERWKAP